MVAIGRVIKCDWRLNWSPAIFFISRVFQSLLFCHPCIILELVLRPFRTKENGSNLMTGYNHHLK